jgi:hypothetical protein
VPRHAQAAVEQIAQFGREIAHAVRAHPDGPILSFFRRQAAVAI